MPWTADNQSNAEKLAADFASQYSTAVDAWTIALRTGGNAVAAKGNVTDIISRWRASVNNLEKQSDVIMSDQTVMDRLGVIATSVAEERATLAKLRSESGTRFNQADSVNPKIRTSPYTNILGLRRAFRESTRFAILIASIVFGILALATLGYIGFIVSGPAIGAISGALGSVTGAPTGVRPGLGPPAPGGRPGLGGFGPPAPGGRPGLGASAPAIRPVLGFGPVPGIGRRI